MLLKQPSWYLCSLQSASKGTATMQDMQLVPAVVPVNVACPILLQDVHKSAEAARAWQSELGGKVVREAGPLPGLKARITSITDPGGCSGRLGRCCGSSCVQLRLR